MLIRVSQNLIAFYLNYTVFRKKTHPYVFLYLHVKCLDFHKIFRKCFGEN